MTSTSESAGFVDELYARFQQDPSSVSEAWQEFFLDYHGQAKAELQASPSPDSKKPKPKQTRVAPPAQDKPAASVDTTTAKALTGITAAIAKNMVQSLEVPTATSVRTIAVKLMEENRRVINAHQAVMAKPKVSFTHMIAWAIVRSIKNHPGMNAGYELREGKPYRIDGRPINLGLAIDMEKKGERILVVPSIKNAEKLSFNEFLAAYNALVKRAKANKLTMDDYAGTNCTLTNPGMIGTAMSVPRLMQGQGAIFGVGSINYPAEYSGMSPQVISELGLSKVMTVTSTYDHRVIQGAESGGFLKSLEEFLSGKADFYDELFKELDLPHEPMRMQGDKNPAFRSGLNGDVEAIAKQAGVQQLIRAHRSRGHLYAHLDPLEKFDPETYPELELSTYGLSVWDLDRHFVATEIAGKRGLMTLREILDTLRDTYCRHIGVEFMHIHEIEIRQWLAERMESTRNAEPFSKEEQFRVLGKISDAEAFERFLHTAYVGQKRFSLEGAETVIAMLDTLVNRAADHDVRHAIVGMAHRGRLNVLSNFIGKSYEAIFREFEGAMDEGLVQGSGDVKYHLGAIGEHVTPSKRKVKLQLAPNPSHLEAVNPIVEGMVRAHQDMGEGSAMEVLPVLLHGDAAFAGQGVVPETLGFSQLPGYSTGGTVHIVINNQIGFTTDQEDAHSSLYCTDIARAVGCPVFHVNGNYPEDAVRTVQLAVDFRQKFKRDVVIDLVCYRRWGHNEGDDPSYTNPMMYAKIGALRSVRKLYTEQLLRRGDIDMEQGEKSLAEFQDRLRNIHDGVREALKSSPKEEARKDLEEFEGVAKPFDANTGIGDSSIDSIVESIQKVPETFTMHPKLEKQLARRPGRVNDDKIDWALAETLAFASICLDGSHVRLSGEDSGRGTFSHRHSILSDYQNGDVYIPLANLSDNQAHFEVYNSHLSEFGVMGFEYGYSVERQDGLILWEAQFGDFVNGGQVIIDQFIASAEEKWNQSSHLVLLLPHGYEGQGPEHSSARIERFLQLCARGNMRVCYPSTPAQYFHLLRRQVKHPSKKPLIVFTPKSMLRLPAAVSSKAEIAEGMFHELLGDSSPPKNVERVVFSMGKLHHELQAYRVQQKVENVALARLEQLYPFPKHEIEAELKKYPNAKEVIWVQEEPKNMGAWDCICLSEHIPDCLAEGQKLHYVGRPPSPSPATGSSKRHAVEQATLVEEAMLLTQ